MHKFTHFFPFFLFLLPFPMPARAQPAFSLALSEIGKTASERPVVETPDGGFALLFSGTLKAQTDSSFFGLAKFSADGVPEWSRYFAIGTEQVQSVALVQTADGGFAAAGAVVAENREQELLLLRLNAHGQMLTAQRYAIDSLSSVNDAFPLQDGSVLITGYLAVTEKERWFTGPQVFVIRVERDGEVGAARRYPALKHFYTGDSKFRPLGNGKIALIGSILEPELFRHVGLACEIAPDGMIRTATAVDPADPDGDAVGAVITDLFPHGDGQYTLLGECRLQINHSDFSSRQFTLSCNAGRTELPARFYDRNSAMRFSTFLPGGEDRYMLTGGTGVEGDIAIEETESSRGRQSLTVISVFPDSLLKPGLIRRPLAPFICLSLSDRGMLVLTQQENSPLMISRLPPDFTPCNGAPGHSTTEERTDACGSNGSRSQSLTRSVETVPIEFEVKSRPLISRAVDFPLEPEIICQGSDQALSSSARRETTGEGFSRLTLSPNSVRTGESCAARFELQGKEKPEIAILEIATGRTVREVPAGAVLWSEGTGTGSGTIKTQNLPPGIYIVRLRSGEHQVTAMLEVR